MNEDNIIALDNGRILGYAQYGDPSGKPLIYIHGWPASRLSGRQLDESGRKYHFRVIAPDRPGIGLSTFDFDRTLLSTAGDIRELIRKLGLKNVLILGSSGGAPYVYACAYLFPQIINKAVVSSGLGPLYLLAEKKRLTGKYYLAVLAARLVPELVRIAVNIHFFVSGKMPALYQKWMLGTHAVNDVRKFSDEKFRKMVLETRCESTRQGTHGPVRDWNLYLAPWGFPLEKIKKTIYMFHGDQDRQVPIQIAGNTADLLPNAKLTVFQSFGHYLLTTAGDRIFTQL